MSTAMTDSSPMHERLHHTAQALLLVIDHPLELLPREPVVVVMVCRAECLAGLRPRRQAGLHYEEPELRHADSSAGVGVEGLKGFLQLLLLDDIPALDHADGRTLFPRPPEQQEDVLEQLEQPTAALPALPVGDQPLAVGVRIAVPLGKGNHLDTHQEVDHSIGDALLVVPAQLVPLHPRKHVMPGQLLADSLLPEREEDYGFDAYKLAQRLDLAHPLLRVLALHQVLVQDEEIVHAIHVGDELGHLDRGLDLVDCLEINAAADERPPDRQVGKELQNPYEGLGHKVRARGSWEREWAHVGEGAATASDAPQERPEGVRRHCAQRDHLVVQLSSQVLRSAPILRDKPDERDEDVRLVELTEGGEDDGDMPRMFLGHEGTSRADGVHWHNQKDDTDGPLEAPFVLALSDVLEDVVKGVGTGNDCCQ
eukprot:CAMPEP_0179140576 /NCGR_PEP_ID=MMETSP0796-20121207/67329_1 /TAXON_ID=73915 /ORGANISM="Pyrodinium bahamense, Strain pbaha01" /LENGTH=424 /DNA_ID=CAMNT_0020840147 /DNA_START=100 /DNA_END=1371 /DNA_ORIENTATION=-